MPARVLTLSALMVILSCASAVDVEKAMVKIYATSADYYYFIPWSTNAPHESSGSGCIIEGNMILTNAHVVRDVTYLQVRREGDPKRYTARVVSVSHEADLALITVDNPAFFQGIEPLRLGELPRTRDMVTVFGYPEGGDALSTTQGVISRIETCSYAHSNLTLLSVQIDAAINPGNSGGPAIVDGRVIGVAMQARTQSENIGYVIPVPVIRHFLEDLADGAYDGFPSLGFNYQKITNPAITERYGIGEQQTGVLIVELAYDSPASEVLRTGDVILEIDGQPIAGDGTIELQRGVRTTLDYLFTRRQIGESIPLLIVRDRERSTVRMNLDRNFESLCLVPERIYDRPPQYFIYGGLVFMPLTLNYLELWGNDWQSKTHGFLSSPYLFNNWRTAQRTRMVILAYVLPSEVNTGYQTLNNLLIQTVDGVPVSGFHHLVALLDGADGEFVEIGTNLGHLVILNVESALKDNEEILFRYGIPADRQMD